MKKYCGSAKGLQFVQKNRIRLRLPISIVKNYLIWGVLCVCYMF